jgi:hypothetical protein
VGGRWNPRQACRAAAYARWPCRRRQRVPVARGSGPGTAFVGDFICGRKSGKLSCRCTRKIAGEVDRRGKYIP